MDCGTTGSGGAITASRGAKAGPARERPHGAETAASAAAAAAAAAMRSALGAAGSRRRVSGRGGSVWRPTGAGGSTGAGRRSGEGRSTGAGAGPGGRTAAGGIGGWAAAVPAWCAAASRRGGGTAAIGGGWTVGGGGAGGPGRGGCRIHREGRRHHGRRGHRRCRPLCRLGPCGGSLRTAAWPARCAARQDRGVARSRSRRRRTDVALSMTRSLGPPIMTRCSTLSRRTSTSWRCRSRSKASTMPSRGWRVRSAGRAQPASGNLAQHEGEQGRAATKMMTKAAPRRQAAGGSVRGAIATVSLSKKHAMGELSIIGGQCTLDCSRCGRTRTAAAAQSAGFLIIFVAAGASAGTPSGSFTPR